jgi:F-type H+-transporting ATPase subunit a
MHGTSLFEHPTLTLGLSVFGRHPQLNLDTIAYTWAVLGFIALIGLLARFILARHPNSLFSFAVIAYVEGLTSLVEQATHSRNPRYITFFGALFTFILVCNLLILVPGLEEPTKDLNTTLAVALISFTFVQLEGIRAHGLLGYIGEFMKMPFRLTRPTGNKLLGWLFLVIKAVLNVLIGTATLPLELLGKAASIISLSFRLFGNIFGGSMIHGLWHSAITGSLLGQLANLFLGINLIIMLFFGLFEGFIQAFVFTMLSLTYVAMARGDEHTEKGGETAHA